MDAFLPVADATKTCKEAGQLKGWTVLIVDDHETNILVLKALIDVYGPQKILVARNGKEALDIFYTQDCDLVFMDIQMPVLDGLAATERIRRCDREGCAYTPVIAVTAMGRVFDAADAAAAGMDGYIEKPVTRDRLEVEIEKAMARARDRSQSVAQPRPADALRAFPERLFGVRG